MIGLEDGRAAAQIRSRLREQPVALLEALSLRPRLSVAERLQFPPAVLEEI